MGSRKEKFHFIRRDGERDVFDCFYTYGQPSDEPICFSVEKSLDIGKTTLAGVEIHFMGKCPLCIAFVISPLEIESFMQALGNLS